MTVSLTDSRALARADAEAAVCERVRIYDGTPPASATAALSGNNALVTIELNTPPYNSAAMVGDDAVANINVTPAKPQGVVQTAGTPTFYRKLGAADAVLYQGDVGTELTGIPASVHVGMVITLESPP